MRATQIVERDIKGDGRKVAIDLFREAVAKPRKPLRSHAEREILPLNIGRADFFGLAGYGLPLYSDY